MGLSTDQPHVNDPNVRIQTTIIVRGSNPPEPQKLGGASIVFRFQPPPKSGVQNFTKPATVDGDGTAGICFYTTVTADLSVDGTWSVQAWVTDQGTTDPWHADTWEFKVLPNLP